MPDSFVHVQVAEGTTPEWIFDFPSDTPRSRDGAVHIRPGTLLLTEEELQHMQTKHARLARVFRVISRPEKATEVQEGPSITGTVALTLDPPDAGQPTELPNALVQVPDAVDASDTSSDALTGYRSKKRG